MAVPSRDTVAPTLLRLLMRHSYSHPGSAQRFMSTKVSHMLEGMRGVLLDFGDLSAGSTPNDHASHG